MCGPVWASQGARVEKIVAAGGGDDLSYFDRVEIFDITSNKWATGEFREFRQWRRGFAEFVTAESKAIRDEFRN